MTKALTASESVICERTDYHKFLHGDHYSPRKRLYLEANVLPALNGIDGSAPILEIGPGHGELLRLLRDKCFSNVEAFEVCPSLASAATAEGFSIHEGECAAKFLSKATKQWQAIILIDVLEHLDLATAIELLKHAMNRLSEGGRLIVQVPNASGIYGANTFAGDPTHKLFLNENGLAKLFHAAGWQDFIIGGVRLPNTAIDTVRTILRPLVFLPHKIAMRAVGASPVKILASNLFAVASRK